MLSDILLRGQAGFGKLKRITLRKSPRVQGMTVRKPLARRWRWILPAALLLLGEVRAQVRLPNVQVPQLPPIQLPTADGIVTTAAGAMDPSRLRGLRRL